MTQFIFATESYPFTTDLRDLIAPGDTAILVTKDVHLTMREDQLACFERVVIVPVFEYEILHRAFVADVRPDRDARIVSHDDFFYALFARLNHELGLVGYSTASILPFVDKDVMKRRLAGSKMRIPRYVKFDGAAFTAAPRAYVADVTSYLGAPMFAKPTNSAGAENAAFLLDSAALYAWCEAHAAADDYELDEFIDGDLYHCDSIIQHGRVVFSQVARYSCPCADFVKGEMIGSYTMDEREALVERIRRFAASAIETFALTAPVPDGVTHMEVFHTAGDELVFLEVQLRPPGGNVRVAYEQYLQVNLELHHYRLQMGRDITLPAPRGPYAAWLYFPTDDGTVKEVLPLPALRSSVVESVYFVERGRSTHRPRSCLDAKGRGVVALSLVVSCPDYETLQEDFGVLIRHRPYLLAG